MAAAVSVDDGNACQVTAPARKELISEHHPHPLTLRKKPAIYRCERCKCDGYGRRYRCKECKVSLHEICAACPDTIDFFMHMGHPLTLQRSLNPVNRHTCEVCGEHTHGFFYRCKPCSFELHPFCSLLQPTTVDAAHPGHTLRCARPDQGAQQPCAVCGEPCVKWRFCCDECGVHIHMGCLHAASGAKALVDGLEEAKAAGGVETDRKKKKINAKKVKQATKVLAAGGALVVAVLAAAGGQEVEGDLFGGFGEDGGDGGEDYDSYEGEEEEEAESEEEEEVEKEASSAEEQEEEEETEQTEENKEEETEEKEEEKTQEKKKSKIPFKKLFKKHDKGGGDDKKKKKNK